MKMLAALLVLSVTMNLGASVVSAAETASEKEEVVYAILDESGNVTGVYVVNSFAGGDVVDYGSYTNIRNLTTTDEITAEGDKITLHTDADKVYYQGDLESTDIPWNIDIHYFMDGKEYAAEEIAGMSGALEITISITQNQKCDASFWEGYALQASLTLDTKCCENIEAADATIANVGSDKQLSYIILPGKGAELSITADVTAFEMEGISINATKLSMDIELDDSELTDKFQEVQDAIAKLDDGALALDDGAGALNDGAKSIYDGSVSLNDGTKSLNDGMSALNTGIGEMKSALETLNGQSQALTGGSAEVLGALETIQSALNAVDMNAEELQKLSAASTDIAGGINSLVGGLQTLDGSIASYYQALGAAGLADVNSFAATNEAAVAALGITDTQRAVYGTAAAGGDVAAKLQELAAAGNTEASALLAAVSSGSTNAVSDYVATAGKLIQIEALLKADVAYINGSNTLISGIDGALDSQNGELMNGALGLQAGYAEFDQSIQGMVQTLGNLVTNLGMLKSGVDTLVTNYATLNQGIISYTDAVAKIVNGYQQIYEGSAQVTSGASALYEGTRSMTDGTDSLYTGIAALKEGTTELQEGTGEFREETEGMDTEISDTIHDKIDEMTGKNIETISFVSDKNTKVQSVLFVIKTPAIEIPEVEEVKESEAKTPGFWERFLNLFR